MNNTTKRKEWTGNSNSVFKTLGASSHATEQRQPDDYYATIPIAAEHLLDLDTFSTNIWECACGEGHLSKVFETHGFNVTSTDLVDRGYGQPGVDFLKYSGNFNGDIITNPPYTYAQEFVEKALQVISPGNKVAMFLKLTFLESKGRKQFFLDNPPKFVHVSSSRLACAKNGDFDKHGSSAVAYAWYLWEKGYNGDTVLKWFN